MLRRVVILALLAWAILAMPSLCSAGVLEHLCACGVSNSCSHEESCSADPCVIAKPTTENGAMMLSLAPTPAMLVFPVAECLQPATLDSWCATNLNILAVPPALRFGARPLLI